MVSGYGMKVWLGKLFCVFACDQECFCLKTFLNRSKQNETGMHIPEFVQWKLVCNCWTNDYTLDHLDSGKSVQGGIECVTVCHLNYFNFS